MTDTATLSSGKTHKDENFPVASFLIARAHRKAILAFYRFARAADDVADHTTARPSEKLALLESMRATLAGEANISPEATTLRAVCTERGLSIQHGLDLLEAFRRDVTKLRYRDWDDLMDYCRCSANPVGRFVLDVHGESHMVWPLSDALCSALQVINHLQDCAEDYRDLNRVYIPEEQLEAAGLTVEALAGRTAPPALLKIIRSLAERTSGLLRASKPFAGSIRDKKLGLEVAIIQRLAESLNNGLMRRDPLSQRVHHRKVEALGLAVLAAGKFFTGRAQ